MSPDGQTVVTGAGDETLRFWNVFYKSRSHKVCYIYILYVAVTVEPLLKDTVLRQCVVF